jgi:hypothetical protein
MPKIIKNGLVYGAAPSSNVWEGTQAQYDAIENKDPNITYYITDGAVEPIPATNISYNNTTSGLSATQVQSAIDKVVSQIDTKTPKSIITNYILNSSNPVSVTGIGGYAVLLVIGFAQGIGSVSLILTITNNALTVVNMKDGTTFSNSNLTFSYSSSTHIVTITSPNASISQLVIIIAGIRF